MRTFRQESRKSHFFLVLTCTVIFLTDSELSWIIVSYPFVVTANHNGSWWVQDLSPVPILAKIRKKSPPAWACLNYIPPGVLCINEIVALGHRWWNAARHRVGPHGYRVGSYSLVTSRFCRTWAKNIWCQWCLLCGCICFTFYGTVYSDI